MLKKKNLAINLFNSVILDGEHRGGVKGEIGAVGLRVLDQDGQHVASHRHDFVDGVVPADADRVSDFVLSNKR